MGREMHDRTGTDDRYGPGKNEKTVYSDPRTWSDRPVEVNKNPPNSDGRPKSDQLVTDRSTPPDPPGPCGPYPGPGIRL